MITRDAARRNAAELRRTLVKATGTTRWRTRTWENFGWHYDVFLPGPVRLEVHGASPPLGSRYYMAFFHHQWVTTNPDPVVALRSALTLGLREVEALAATINTFRPLLRKGVKRK